MNTELPSSNHKRNVCKQPTTELLNEIIQVIQEARNKVQRVINHAMVGTYWNIGRLIVEHEQKGADRAIYGKKQIENLSYYLTDKFGKGFDERNLRNMRSFYLTFPIWNTVCTKLSWSHYRALIRIENDNARQWYIQEAIEQNWSARALERQINVLYYERLLSSKDKIIVMAEAKNKTLPLETGVKDFLRDPYVLEFLNLHGERFLENDLERGILENIQNFLLELGKGFAFVARQQKISTEDQDFYIDLVFYNFKLKCFLLIDLKLDKLSHQDVGQMDSYIRIYDQYKKASDDNPTIGLILCSHKSEAVAKYSVLADSKQIFAAKYILYLPSEEELSQELERDRFLIQEKLQPKKFE